jgi:hypothetical protein
VSTGWQKKTNPSPNVVPLTNRADVTNRDSTNPGATRAASFILGFSCGNGGFGESALD